MKFLHKNSDSLYKNRELFFKQLVHRVDYDIGLQVCCSIVCVILQSYKGLNSI